MLVGIKNDVQSSQVSIFNVDYKEHKKKFNSLGNTVIPSLNVFIDGKPMTVIDTKMAPRKKIGIFNRQEKIVDKKTTAIVGKPSKEDLLKLFKHSLERIN